MLLAQLSPHSCGQNTMHTDTLHPGLLGIATIDEWYNQMWRNHQGDTLMEVKLLRIC